MIYIKANISGNVESLKQIFGAWNILVFASQEEFKLFWLREKWMLGNVTAWNVVSVV